MIKLSKTGWNNVIIFAVMGFILLINATNKDVFSQRDKENSSMAKEQPLIGEEQVILTLLINNVIEIKRIGKSWQAVPAKINSQALEQMMMSWQKSVGTRLEESPTFTREFSLDVKLILIDIMHPWLNPNKQILVLFNLNSFFISSI